MSVGDKTLLSKAKREMSPEAYQSFYKEWLTSGSVKPFEIIMIVLVIVQRSF